MNLKNKYIIATDTICDGWVSSKDENNLPLLFDSFDEAMFELFDDAVSMLENRSDEELEEYNEDVTHELVTEMRKCREYGDTEAMANFLKKNPNCNDNNEFIVPAEEFLENRKTIFTNQGIKIEGKTVEELLN